MTAPDRRSDARHVFLIEAADEIDILIRLLGPLAVKQVRVVGLEVRHAAAGVAVRLETEPLDAIQARRLADKLATLPVVRSLAFGWMGGAVASGAALSDLARVAGLENVGVEAP